MTKTENAQIDLFESILPFAKIDDNPLLKNISQALDEDVSILQEVKDVISKRYTYSKTLGRHSAAVESVLRMLILKHLFNWSFRDTTTHVKDSFVLRQFTRIYFEDVPHYSNLSRYEKMIPEPILKKINKKIIAIAKGKKITKGRKLRVDTTVVETNIHYPTDSSLLSNGIQVLAGISKKLKQAGIVAGEITRDFTRSAKRQVLNIVKFARGRSETAQQQFKKSYGQLITICTQAVNNGKKLKRTVVNRARHLGQKANQIARHAKEQLDHYIPLIERVIDQSKRRVFHGESIANHDKLISLFEPQSYVIRKGKRHKPNEFGQVVKIQESDGGIITDFQSYPGHIPDCELFVPSIERHIDIFKKPPYLASADRGFYSQDNETKAYEKGVKRVCLPKKGKKSKERSQLEKSRWFKMGQRFRAGSEGKISVLKRVHGLNRSLNKGQQGYDQWIGWGVIAANLKVIATN